MLEINTSLVRLTVLAALCAVSPAGIALASEQGPAFPGSTASVNQAKQVRDDQIAVRSDSGRDIKADAEHRALVPTRGERERLPGGWARDSWFKTGIMNRSRPHYSDLRRRMR
jgi:hypothetical protein